MFSNNVNSSSEQCCESKYTKTQNQPIIFRKDETNIIPYEEPIHTGNSRFLFSIKCNVDLVENENIFRERMQKNYAIEDRYFCTICTKLLNQPVQIECGCRFCKVCIETYKITGSKTCPSSSSECNVHDFKILFDKAVNKEMEKITIKCINNDCRSKVLLSNLYSHLQNCEFSSINCQFCFKKILLKNKNIHETNECENKIITCPVCGNDISQIEYQRYHKNSSNSTHKCLKNVENIKETVTMREKDKKEHIELLINKVETLERQKEKIDLDYNKRDDLTRSVDELKLELDQIKLKLKEYSKDFVIDSYFIWKVKEFDTLLNECKTGNSSCYLSKPFYTKEIGYKLYLKMYPYGDGTARGSHLSIFVAIARGKYDSLLSWPFLHKYTIKLLNQKGGKPFAETFKPDSNSQCYQRPEKEMNLASGNPKFIEHKTLYETDDYVKNGVLFIKLEVMN